MSGGQLLFLADLVLFFHFMIAAYLVFGLPAIWLGRTFRWPFIRNSWFRYSHAGLMGFVFLESVAGIFCPLTTFEGLLRRMAGVADATYNQSFVAYWFEKMLFYDFEELYFILAYGLFFIAVILTLFLVPVDRKRK